MGAEPDTAWSAGCVLHISRTTCTTPIPTSRYNGIGHYSGTVPLDAGPSVLQIGADGTWTAGVAETSAVSVEGTFEAYRGARGDR